MDLVDVARGVLQGSNLCIGIWNWGRSLNTMAVAWTLRAKPCGRGSGVVREQNLFLLKLLALSSTELAVTKFTAVSTLAPGCRIRAPPKVLRLLQ